MTFRSIAMMLWIGFGITILVGVILYWCRCRHRVLYGAAEILVALLLLYLFFFPETKPFDTPGGWSGSLGPVWGALLSNTVTLFAALYALVRGLDNVDALEKWNRLMRRRGDAASSDPQLVRELLPPRKVYAPPRSKSARRRRR
jgi:hypothetical protein